MSMQERERAEKPSIWLTAARVLLPIALIACVVFIFSNSLAIGTVSEGSSGRVLAFLQRVLTRLGMPDLAGRITMHMVRKAAHFCEYALEGFLLLLCLRVYLHRWQRHLSGAMLLGLLTALADETIQLYSPGRSSQVMDVWIDFSGVLTGMAVGAVFAALATALVGAFSRPKMQHRNED